MKITGILTYSVSAGRKDRLFIKVCTDCESYGIGEATMNSFIKKTEAAIYDWKHFPIGRDPREVTAIARKIVSTVQDASHIHRLTMAATTPSHSGDLSTRIVNTPKISLTKRPNCRISLRFCA